jgi:hypothetical protein
LFAELAEQLKQKPFKIIADLMEVGGFLQTLIKPLTKRLLKGFAPNTATVLSWKKPRDVAAGWFIAPTRKA